MKKLYTAIIWCALAPSLILSQDSDSDTSTQPSAHQITKGFADTQDLNTPTKLCREDNFCSYFEVDIGYRHDNVKNTLDQSSTWYNITGSRQQKSDFCQLNFRGGFKFLKYLFLNGAIGYGFLTSDKETESSFLTNTNILVNSYSKKFTSGHTFDWLVEGGFFLPLYKQRIAFLPEIGYGSKKYYVKNSLDLKVSSPYAGGKLYFAPGANIGLSIYGNYFFAPTRSETGWLYLVSSNSFFKTHDVKTHHGIPTYNVGANISYLFTRHFSVSFNWERFQTSASQVDIEESVINNVESKIRLNHWISNEYMLGIRYSF